MRYLKLNDIREHLNIDEWFHDDDYLIANIGEAVEDIAEHHIDDDLSALEDKNGDIPRPLIQAMLLLCGHFYANREAVSFGTPHEVPLAYSYLLDLFRRYNRKEGANNCNCNCGRD